MTITRKQATWLYIAVNGGLIIFDERTLWYIQQHPEQFTDALKSPRLVRLVKAIFALQTYIKVLNKGVNLYISTRPYVNYTVHVGTIVGLATMFKEVFVQLLLNDATNIITSDRHGR